MKTQKLIYSVSLAVLYCGCMVGGQKIFAQSLSSSTDDLCNTLDAVEIKLDLCNKTASIGKGANLQSTRIIGPKGNCECTPGKYTYVVKLEKNKLVINEMTKSNKLNATLEYQLESNPKFQKQYQQLLVKSSQLQASLRRKSLNR